MEVQKTKEGLYHLAKASNHLQTGFLKRKPDYDKAALEYARAALAFRSAKQMDRAADAFVKQTRVHEKTQEPLYAGKAYEQAGLLLSESKKLAEAAQVIKQGIDFYLESGNADITAMTLRRFSQILESHLPHQVVRLYQRASELFERDDRILQTLDLTGRASKMLVRSKDYGEAAISLNKEKYWYQEVESFPTCYKTTVAQSLAHLRNNDFTAASKCVLNCHILGFKGSREYIALVQLLKCYDNKDQNGVDKICRSPVFQLLDHDYSKMVKKLKVPGSSDLRGRILPPPSALMCPPHSEDQWAPTTTEEEEEVKKEEEVEKEKEKEKGITLPLECTTC
uniref:Gamma-soluble NSF attachment protein n=1 Tax=Vombatus ursinus TaxID=29139 RepID=A0A4X2L330_VOMUR